MAKETQRNIVRDIFVILLCGAVIGIGVSVIVDRATNQYTAFLPSPSSLRTALSSHTIVNEEVDTAPVPAPAPAPAPPPPPPAEEDTLPLDALDAVLAKTANKNKTVILTALNEAWAQPNSMIDLFLESFRIGDDTQHLLSNLLIVCMDAEAYSRCLQIHPHCYSLVTKGMDFSAEKVFMSHDYLIMMWRRLGFLGEILKRGYSFVFSDCDIMWLRDPFKIFDGEADIQIASDRFNGMPEDVNNMPNGGYKYVRSNERTVGFYKWWYMSRRLFPGQNEQDVLNILKFRGSFKKMVRMRFLDTKHFGGFCQRSDSLEDAYTMHANCCKGLHAKLIDLRHTLDDWLSYSQHHNISFWSAPLECQRSWF